MTGPIRPDGVAARKTATLPDVVFDVFNDLIARNHTGRSATVLQKDVVAALLERDPLLTRERIFASHLLDVEAAYAAAGWDVTYDKPGFNESYPTSFTFSKK
jgi:hypothetical protein